MALKKLLIMAVLIFLLHLCYSIDVLSKFHQSDYFVRNLRLEVTYVNKSLIRSFDAVGYKHNRTITAINATFWPRINLEDKTEFVLQAYKRASNEYRLFPIRFQVNACRSIKTNALGLKNIGQYGNMTRCYWKKNTLYYVRGFVIDHSRLPPYVPSGEFKNIIDVMQLENKLATVDFYLEIYRPDVKNYDKFH